MLVYESLDHLQVTTGTLNGERSVSSFIHCNCEYKQVVSARKICMQYIHAHTFWVTLMFLGKIFDCLQMSTFVAQSKWSITSLVNIACKYIPMNCFKVSRDYNYQSKWILVNHCIIIYNNYYYTAILIQLLKAYYIISYIQSSCQGL